MKATTLLKAKGIVRTKDVVGVNVKNLNDQDLGEIKEIVLEKLTGKVRYLVLSFGGFMGMGNKLFAIPWNAIHYDTKKDAFVLNMAKEKLQNAPGFEKDQYPDFEDTAWSNAIQDFYDESSRI